MASVTVVDREGSGGNVFGHPARVSRPTVEGRGCGQGRMKVGDRAREAILEKA